MDVSRESDWASAIAATEERFGRIDGILSNAGEVLHAPLEQLTIDQFQLVVQVNIEGTFLALKHGLAALAEAAAAPSWRSRRPLGYVRNSAAAPITHPRRRCSISCARRRPRVRRSTPRIQVNAICPGMIWSGEDADKLSAPRLREIQGIIDRTPLGRSGLPEEVAAIGSPATGG
ncbi:MAG: SDR family oxidoreductase [Alphaproteobacteria bacterium]